MNTSRSATARLVNFLGSMYLAITLLIILALASVIGTVLQQNQPYPDYEIKLGKFWFELFRTLGLYDLYSTPWFLLILGFLLVSTTTCVARNTPSMLQELRHFRENAQKKSLQAMAHTATFTTQQSQETVKELAQQVYKAENFRYRENQNNTAVVLAAMKGGTNKWGYWLTHIGIIVICIGGLMDSRLPLMISEWKGDLKPETRNIPASQVPPESRLDSNTFSFRGSVDIPEGRRANIIFLPMRDGYLVQRLPFEVEVKDFRVEHYSTGQPKSFESDLLIYDADLEEPIERTIAVNHPLIYKGNAIYQANFGDGGSEIQMRLHPFNSEYAAQDLSGKVFESYKLSRSKESFQLELSEFKLFNINPVTNSEGKEEQKNIGPSFTFRLRNAAGEAIEYTNYMNPIAIEGRLYLVSGVRKSPTEPQRFLHIPADDKGSSELFFKFMNALQDETYIRAAALTTTQQTMQNAQINNSEIETQIVDSMVHLTITFAREGFEGIFNDIDQRFPEEQRDAVREAFMKVLQAALRTVYSNLLENKQGKQNLSEADWLFFDDSLNAIANQPFYGSPWFIQMTGFKHIEASGLQITRAPGQPVVYIGCIMLVIGVFLMFYIAQRRIWVRIEPLDNGQTEVILAGSSNRHKQDFETYFQRLQKAFQQALAT